MQGSRLVGGLACGVALLWPWVSLRQQHGFTQLQLSGLQEMPTALPMGAAGMSFKLCACAALACLQPGGPMVKCLVMCFSVVLDNQAADATFSAPAVVLLCLLPAVCSSPTLARSLRCACCALARRRLWTHWPSWWRSTSLSRAPAARQAACSGNGLHKWFVAGQP